jgi:UDPglucose 6-dehydrogenase
MKIAVVGSGYVGLVAAACLAELGHELVCLDNDDAKLSALKRGEVPIHEEFLPELLAKHRGSRLVFSDSIAEAVQISDAIFIAVGTPPAEDGYADLSYVECVAREIGRAIRGYKVVIEKSTVPVNTSDCIRRTLILNGVPTSNFDVVSNPEFLREGTAVPDFLYPDRIVVGADSPRAAALLRIIYEPLTSGRYYKEDDAIPGPDNAHLPPRLILTSAKSAELIKHASNAFLAMKISFINAVATICEQVGADVTQLCEGIGADSRIGPRFLNPGIGYGGSCFPKDLAAFRAVARDCGYDFRLLDEVMHINEDQRTRFLRKVRTALWTLKGKKVAVLGLAFKGGTDDIRESPAVSIVNCLAKEGCEVVAYDPAASARAAEVLPSKVTYAETAYDAASGADALLILTDWEEFAALDLKRLHGALKYPIVVDGRNLFNPDVMSEHGFLYVSVGRPDAAPKQHDIAQARKAV